MSDTLGRDEPFRRGPFKEDGMTGITRTWAELARLTGEQEFQIKDLTAERDAALAEAERLKTDALPDMQKSINYWGDLCCERERTIAVLRANLRKWKRRAKKAEDATERALEADTAQSVPTDSGEGAAGACRVVWAPNREPCQRCGGKEWACCSSKGCDQCDVDIRAGIIAAARANVAQPVADPWAAPLSEKVNYSRGPGVSSHWPNCEVCGEPCIPGHPSELSAYDVIGPHRAAHTACQIQRETISDWHTQDIGGR